MTQPTDLPEPEAEYLFCPPLKVDNSLLETGPRCGILS